MLAGLWHLQHPHVLPEYSHRRVCNAAEVVFFSAYHCAALDGPAVPALCTRRGAAKRSGTGSHPCADCCVPVPF
jgi:hypothetical protein